MILLRCNPAPEELENFIYPGCDCFRPADDTSVAWRELVFHNEPVDFSSEEYRQLSALILHTAEHGLKEFAPRKELGRELCSRIIRLPPSIELMDRVEKMDLYGSHLVAIPREILAMTRLQEFDAYTSYRLHWLPYEIARCPALKKSRISIRALYENYKRRPPFPRLPEPTLERKLCSVCDTPLTEPHSLQRWITLGVATDWMPLLVNACSGTCLNRLPAPASWAHGRPHKGGVSSRPTGRPSR